ncbi:hypothetical protein PR202_ga17252 [Eleusine coracana subsp. coracana]|uniref:FAE domain-containing protein n=1 Tax=Eleusine coracana subsp. coracana TaxID=191504 RepID=A0AAV5CPN2_ELECO|nr:hypothetical protein PR202_ga17252 [Eleusine coracana subsp. coracana]
MAICITEISSFFGGIPFSFCWNLLHHASPSQCISVDYACFRPPPNCRIPKSSLVEHAHHMPSMNDKSVDFMARMLDRSGLSDQTYLPAASHYIPPSRNMNEARSEAEHVIFSTIDDLLAKTCTSPEEIDILITNCTIFNPTPCFVDMIINEYRLRGDIRVMQISGMGCSAGLISVDAAKNLLQLSQGVQMLLWFLQRS